MALWLSGIIFLLCCEMSKTEAAPEDSCPLGRMKGHCDKAKNKMPSATLSGRQESQEVDCCGFIPAVFDKARKIQKSEPLAQPESIPQPGSPTLLSVGDFRQNLRSYSTKTFARKKIFIMNRVLRI